MLSGKLREYFRNYVFLDGYVTLLYEALKRMQSLGEGYGRRCAGRRAEAYENLRTAEQLTRGEDHLWRQVLETLEGWKW